MTTFSYFSLFRVNWAQLGGSSAILHQMSVTLQSSEGTPGLECPRQFTQMAVFDAGSCLGSQVKLGLLTRVS